MKIDLSQFRQTFLQESADHIVSMETGLLELRTAPADVELLNSIFRSAHSIKGGAGSFGMANLVRVTHSLENMLDRLRSLEMHATDEVIDILLRSVDILRVLLDADPEAAMPPDALELGERIEALMSAEPGETEDLFQEIPTPQETSPPAEEACEIKLYTVEFHPDREIYSSGTNPIVLLRNLAELGTASCCHLHTEDLPALADLDPGQCYLSWTVELASVCEEAELRDVFEFVEHLAEIRISRSDAPPQQTFPPPQNSTPSPDLPNAPVLSSPPPFVERRKAPVADRRQSSVADRRQSPARSAAGGDSGSIRVAIDKVDRLIDLVGELVIAHVMTAQMVEGFEPSCLPKLREAVASMERNTRELHERVMGIRMLPVGTLFQRYTRTVYDIAQSTGKKLRLQTDGEDTEIDKSMLELLGDPLTHLVRNAADHGIEAPDVRRAAGKPEEGTITLRAFHRAGRVVIEVAEDGAGIDIEKVRSKAVERGLIGPDALLTAEQIQMLIFEPGFSTSETISDLSGRGVGMDVVKRNVQQLHGTVALSSEKGQGATVTIELPLTLAILEGLLVRVGDRTLVLPLLSVIETVPLRDGQIVRVAEQGEVVMIRGVSVPLLRLSRFLGLQPEPSADASTAAEAGLRRLAVIVEAGNRKIGLVVDELLGQQQVVVKSLERHLHKVHGLMGATILGDGHVAPIVDVAGIGALNLYSLQSPVGISTQTAPPGQPVRAPAPAKSERGGTSNELV
jgi:two-component system chemotaxis sensor kinase CheA